METVVIVGITSPFSENLCKRYATKKARLVLIDWSNVNINIEQGLISTCTSLGSPKTASFKGNLSQELEWKKIVATISQEFGKIDILYYLDGAKFEQNFKDIGTLDFVTQVMEKNFYGPLYAIHSALPLLRSSCGHVVVIGDTSDRAKNSVYRSSKQTLSAFLSTIRKEEEKITFSIFLPSSVGENVNVDLLVSSVAKKEFRISDNLFKDNRKTKILKKSIELEPQICDPPPLNPQSANALSKALYNNNKIAIKDIFKTKNMGILEEKDQDGRTPMHYACYVGHLDNVATLLNKIKKKNLINEPDNYKFSPLHLACYRGNLKIVRRLMNSSADPNYLGSGNMSPLHYLARLDPVVTFSNSAKINQTFGSTLKQLLDAGADSNQRNIDWATPVHEACKTGSIIAVECLLKHEGDVHRKTRATNETPLHCAIRNGNRNIIKLLLDRGADPSALSSNGTCFDIATASLVELLEQYREKNRRQESDDTMSTREVIMVEKLEDLPADCQKMIQSAQFNAPIPEQNWDILFHVLKFLTKRTYLRPGQPMPHHTSNVGSKVLEITLDQATEQFLSNGNPRKLFRILEDAGKGGFGTVFKAKRLDDKKLFAIKKIPHLSDKEQWNNFDELHFLQSCDHPNIVKYFNSYVSRDEIWVIMEYLEGGSLSEVASRRLEETHICYIVKHILKGLKYLHDRKMVHRDLKSANVMLSITAQIKLIDFGLCADVTRGNLESMVGSPFWIPPEMVQKKKHGCPADIWSLGILCIEMAMGKPPYRFSSLRAMYEIGVGNVPHLDEEKWSKPFISFLHRMLIINPEDRATAAELLQDPWIKSLKKNAVMEMRDILRSIFLEKSLELSLGVGIS